MEHEVITSERPGLLALFFGVLVWAVLAALVIGCAAGLGLLGAWVWREASDALGYALRAGDAL